MLKNYPNTCEEVKEMLLLHFPSINWLSLRSGFPSRQAITQWQRIPSQHVIKLEKLSNGLLTPHKMRPDLYPKKRRNV